MRFKIGSLPEDQTAKERLKLYEVYKALLDYPHLERGYE